MTTRKNFNTQIKAYLLTALFDEDHGLTNPSDLQLASYCKDRFYSEYGFMVARVGLQAAIREWLLGLALSVDYTYYDIEQRLLSWGILEGNYTEGKRNKEFDLYWTRLASNLAQMFNKVD